MDLGPKPKVPSKTAPLRKRIRKLKARVEVLQTERATVLDRAHRVATVRVDSPLQALDIVEQAMVQVTREKCEALARVAELEAELSAEREQSVAMPTIVVSQEQANALSDQRGSGV